MGRKCTGGQGPVRRSILQRLKDVIIKSERVETFTRSYWKIKVTVIYFKSQANYLKKETVEESNKLLREVTN